MASFSPAQVALTGFEVIRRNPRTVLIWAVMFATYQWTTHFVYVSVVTSFLPHTPTGSIVSSPGLSMFGPLAPFLGLVASSVLPFVSPEIIVQISLLSAIFNRVVQRPNDSTFAFVRFGADELRQIAFFLLAAPFRVWGGMIAASVIMIGAMGIPMQMPIVQAFGRLGILLLLGAAGLFLASRLCLAPSLIFDRRKLDIFGSWALTEGRVLPILGGYFLATTIFIVLETIGFGLIKGVVMVIGGPGYNPLAVFSDAYSVDGNFKLTYIVQTGLFAALTAVISPIIYSVGPAIYLALKTPEL